MTVSGRTRHKASRQVGHRWESQTQKTRSAGEKTRTLGTMAQKGQLLAEGEVLERQMSARPQGGCERAQQKEQEGTHGRGSVTLR